MSPTQGTTVCFCSQRGDGSTVRLRGLVLELGPNGSVAVAVPASAVAGSTNTTFGVKAAGGVPIQVAAVGVSVQHLVAGASAGHWATALGFTSQIK